MIEKTYAHIVKTILLILVANNVFAGKELLITAVPQSQSNWCWAACSEMVLNAYQYPTSQQTIANWAVGGANVTNDLKGTNYTVDMVLNKYAKVFTLHTPFNPTTGGGNLSKQDLIFEITDGRPIMAGFYRITTFHHLVLITGYTGTGSGDDVGDVIYLDPDGGKKKQDSYAEFVQMGVSQEWGETLRLYSNPRTPIPSGIGASHTVRLDDEFCTQLISSSTQVLRYEAYKSGDTPISWEWKLIFPHFNGDAVVASWNTSSSQDHLIWNINNFSMPTGYTWKYSYSGEICGRIEVTCFDPDYHRDAINVTFVPDDLYPGVLVFENQSVTNSRSDVRAHELLVTKNDYFLPGGNISLKSGIQIDIRDGTTIQEGSVTKFIIDPALQ